MNYEFQITALKNSAMNLKVWPGEATDYWAISIIKDDFSITSMEGRKRAFLTAEDGEKAREAALSKLESLDCSNDDLLTAAVKRFREVIG